MRGWLVAMERKLANGWLNVSNFTIGHGYVGAATKDDDVSSMFGKSGSQARSTNGGVTSQGIDSGFPSGIAFSQS